MSDVSIVGRLVQSLIAFAIGAAIIGSLGDLVFDSQREAAKALKRGGISYGQWNRQLNAPTSEIKSKERSSVKK